VTLFGPATDALGIRDLFRRVSVAVARGLRGEVWVRAEISTIREQNRWCFLTLAEPARDANERDAFLDVVIWKTQWARIRAQLDRRGLSLREGMTVSLRGGVGLRPGTGHLQLSCSALDTDALLGELVARRLALRKVLGAEGLLEANARVPLSAVPLRVGLVASRHSQGYQDFRSVLAVSGYAFVLIERPVVVQGVGAPREVAAAIERLSGAEVDVIVIVRGGGARTDLDAFDSELVARAVAGAAVPVWTGVGHTGDRSLADEVASASHATPTACAQALVSRVADFDRVLGQRARRLQELARRTGESADDTLHRRRHLLARSAASQLDRHGDGLARRGRDVHASVERALARPTGELRVVAGRLPRLAVIRLEDDARWLRTRAATATGVAADGLARSRRRLLAASGHVDGAARRAVGDGERELTATRRVLTAYDPTRQLERGWTLTFDDHGALVRSAAALRAGQRITSRFVDGERTSVVEVSTVTGS
jgi:exodeoxyribonuclease VII large subunit